MRHSVHNGPLYTLISFVCVFAIVIFYLGLSRAEPVHAAPRSGEDEASVIVRTSVQTDENQPSAAAVTPATGQNGQAADTGRDNKLSLAEESEAELQRNAKVYVTTAYYLNVRAESNARSQILRTVKKGTLLMVTDRLDNGWLQLENEGFVHGAYAEPAEPSEQDDDQPLVDAEPRAAVKSAPVNQTSLRTETGAAALRNERSKPAKPTNEVISSSGLTKEDITEIFEGTQLLGHGLEEAVLEVEEKYGINAYFTIAVMKLESGNGKSRLARVKNNLFGLNATGGNNEQAYSFETKADSVHRFGKLIAEKYVDKGLTTIEKVGRKYCPPNEKWPSLIKSIMKSDFKKVA